MIIEISNKNVLIDDEDYEKISKYKWYLDSTDVKNNLYYFYHNIHKPKHYRISLHRYIIGCQYKDGKVVDHINGNTLDNRKENLRICTQSDNTKNCRKPNTNTTGYKGVSFDKRRKMYYSQICNNGKKIQLGMYKTAKEAYKAYCEAADKYHGEFANYG